MSTVRFSCKVAATDTAIPLNFEILLDNNSVFEQCAVGNSINIEIDIPDDSAQHQLRFCMSGKTPEHTKLDENNNIVKDACLKITEISFDEIELTAILPQVAVYHHDFNGSGKPTQDPFYETMGCNGHVNIEFSTPVYLWLLENM